MDSIESFGDSEDACMVFDINDVSSRLFLGDILQKESDCINMTSLSTLMLLNQTESKVNKDDDTNVTSQLSLAYERLQVVPKILLQELSQHIRVLDISHNEFEDLGFLSEFPHLTNLICDHNKITSFESIPFLPNLELLWMNYCKIKDLYPRVNHLQQSCPNLKYLSLMGNPAAPSYLNGGNFYDYLHYRYFIISLFPHLLHLDDRTVTIDQREEAQRLYRRSFVDKVVLNSQNLPICLRSFKNKVSNLFNPIPSFAVTRQRNIIV